MISKDKFIEKIKKLPNQIPSKTGTAFYKDFNLVGDRLYFNRSSNPNIDWDLNIDLLWEVYSSQKFINTTVVKEINRKRVNSPSVAILLAIGCIDIKGNRI